MNTNPIKQYIEGHDALKEDKKAEALSLLASSLGAKKPTGIMLSSYFKLLNLNEAALTIILHRSKE